MKKIIVANWKMRPNTLAEAEDLFRASAGAIVCPPFVYLEELSKIKSGAILGAQDIAFSDEPPHSYMSSGGEPGQTGEVSGGMLRQFGVRYVIIGHSERRWPRSRISDGGSAATEQSEPALRGESDAIVNAKLKNTLKYELTPIVCIGEKSRDDDFERFLQNQVMGTFFGLSSEQLEKCLIVYEPVWAISTTPSAKADTPESTIESISIIREVLFKNYSLMANHYLYGGSVTSSNVRDFLIKDEISGVLVGGASVDKEEFKKILEIASNV